MSGVNKVILVGHIGKDPEFKLLDGGIPVLTFPLATSEIFTKNGSKVEHTEWHNIVMWRSLAETAVRLLKKNTLIYIEGKLRTRSFIGKDDIKRYTTEIVVEQFNLVGRASDLKEVENNVSLTQ
ncbi:MAG TPA: single-stranded DNA-binding protein [Mucilaginibacter sp.]|nr:single-stranded DNA-binding protein [Mucilaginibacter sp.]